MTEGPATRDSPAPAGAAPADGPTVPGFEILGELGRGGMGVVYKARQVNLKRLVALKLLRDGALAGPQQRARFRIEAEAAARMRHPNVVSIYEVGEHQGRPYFAMELVEGGSLEQHLDGRPQPAPQAAELVRTLALALQHAHARQVVHRDLKPANILLELRAESEGPVIRNPKITDFGLARRLDSDSTAWTQDGAILGTAGYMAPEQAAGKAHDVGPAADVYALGAILYELLTGRPPFAGATARETLEQVRGQDPVSPSHLNARVTPPLDAFCLRCLGKNPWRRYERAYDLCTRLRSLREGLEGNIRRSTISGRRRL